MARKKVTLAYIANDTQRKASFRKRIKGLTNKIRELSILCHVDACAVVYSPYDRRPEVWPSRSRAEAVVARFRSLSKMERTSKMVNQIGFAQRRIKTTREKVIGLRNENNRRDAERFMYQWMAGMESMANADLCNSEAMHSVINETLKDLRSRKEKIKIQGHDGPTSGTATPAPEVVDSTSSESPEVEEMARPVVDPAGDIYMDIFDLADLSYPYSIFDSLVYF